MGEDDAFDEVLRAAAAALVLYALGAVSAWGADAPSGVAACRQITDPVARLACFDRETASPSTPAVSAPPPASSPPAARASPPAAAPAAAVPALNSEQQFGLPEHAVAAREVAAGTRQADIARIEAHVTRFTPAGDGRIVFTLDNDQVWQQLLAEGDLLLKPGDKVTISRGVFGSFWMQAATGRGCKVHRLR